MSTEHIMAALKMLPVGQFLLRDLGGKVDMSMMYKLRGMNYVRTAGKRTIQGVPHAGNYRLQTYQITTKGLQRRGSQ